MNVPRFTDSSRVFGYSLSTYCYIPRLFKISSYQQECVHTFCKTTKKLFSFISTLVTRCQACLQLALMQLAKCIANMNRNIMKLVYLFIFDCSLICKQSLQTISWIIIIINLKTFLFCLSVYQNKLRFSLQKNGERAPISLDVF